MLERKDCFETLFATEAAALDNSDGELSVVGHLRRRVMTVMWKNLR